MKTHATFSAHLEALPQIFLWIEGYLVQLQCPALIVRRLELAIEEAVVNIIRHSRPDQFEIALQGTPGRDVSIALIDRGPPFNPIKEAPPVDRTSPLERRKEGGLGIFLMQHAVDGIEYQREQDRNILTFTKKFY